MEWAIDDLLGLARHGDIIGETDTIGLETTARDAWQQLRAPDATHTCNCYVTLQADRNQLRQVFNNPFGNAVEHGSTGSDGDRGATGVEVMLTRGPDGVTVADDGSGILASKRETVFERGYTPNSEGTGCGLAIVDEIVEAHGWDISVTDSDTGGVHFEITSVDIESSCPLPGPIPPTAGANDRPLHPREPEKCTTTTRLNSNKNNIVHFYINFW